MPALIPLALLALPLVEIGLFIWVGGLLGLMPTLALVVLSSLAGVLVLRSTGRSLVADSRRAFAQGALPGRTIADAMLVGFAGGLLLVPGLLTSALGLLLLLAPVRELLYAFFARHARTTIRVVRPAGAPREEGPRTIELDPDDWRAP
jgi:UPF0716 protein FxsA